jgi:transcriptional regulator with XRE-family HTH domain
MNNPKGFSTSELIARLSRNPAFAERWAVEEQKSILAANVAKLRHQMGLTQLELAGAAGMKQPRIAEIESGEANPKLETLARIASALRVRVSELFADGEPERVVQYQVSVVVRESDLTGSEQLWSRKSYAEIRKHDAANDAFALSA